MTALRVLLSLLLSLPSIVAAQSVTPMHPVKPNGSALFPSAFSSADNIAAQTATFMHGGMMAWDGTNWDLVRLTAGAFHVLIQNGTLAVTQSGTWNIGSITTLPALPAGANTIGGVNLSQYTPSAGRLPVEVIFPTLANTSAISIRCVNAAGNAFESCSGGSVTIGAALPAGTNNIGDVDIASMPSIPAGVNTIGAVNQAGTWTVQPGNTANTTPWLTNEFSSPALVAGQQAVNGTAAALTANTAKEVCVKALLSNTVNVYVGPSGVTTGTGLELGPGDSYCTRVTNTNAISVISSGAGPSVSWAARN